MGRSTGEHFQEGRTEDEPGSKNQSITEHKEKAHVKQPQDMADKHETTMSDRKE